MLCTRGTVESHWKLKQPVVSSHLGKIAKLDNFDPNVIFTGTFSKTLMFYLKFSRIYT